MELPTARCSCIQGSDYMGSAAKQLFGFIRVSRRLIAQGTQYVGMCCCCAQQEPETKSEGGEHSRNKDKANNPVRRFTSSGGYATLDTSNTPVQALPRIVLRACHPARCTAGQPQHERLKVEPVWHTGPGNVSHPQPRQALAHVEHRSGGHLGVLVMRFREEHVEKHHEVGVDNRGVDGLFGGGGCGQKKKEGRHGASGRGRFISGTTGYGRCVPGTEYRNRRGGFPGGA